MLKAELDARVAALGGQPPWPDILADLDALTRDRAGRQALPAAFRPTTRRQHRPARRRRCPAAHCAGYCCGLITNPQRVVPSRSRGAVCRVYSITCRSPLSKMGQNATTALHIGNRAAATYRLRYCKVPRTPIALTRFRPIQYHLVLGDQRLINENSTPLTTLSA
jgi:hypothetical protein